MTSPSSKFVTQWPQMMIINAISQSNPCVVTVTQTPEYVPNQFVRLKIPSGWGMPQINNQVAVVTAVNQGLQELTLSIDSRNYFAFVYPVGGYIPGNGATAQLIPVGDAHGDLAFPFDNLGPNPTFP